MIKVREDLTGKKIEARKILEDKYFGEYGYNNSIEMTTKY